MAPGFGEGRQAHSASNGLEDSARHSASNDPVRPGGRVAGTFSVKRPSAGLEEGPRGVLEESVE